MIADLLGVPRRDREQFQSWSDQLAQVVFAAESRVRTDPTSPSKRPSRFTTYFSELVDERRRRPGDDLVTAMVRASDAGGPSAQELVGACTLLLFAGHETTTGLLANAMSVLLGDDTARRELEQAPDLWPSAVDELLRFEGPAKVMARKASCDRTWHGAEIKARDTVFLVILAANRDPAIFPEPDRFDIRRDPNPHFGFGWGLHHCLGAVLARLETRIALRRLFERFPHLHRDRHGSLGRRCHRPRRVIRPGRRCDDAPRSCGNRPPDVRERTRIGAYLDWLDRSRSLSFDTYDDLWTWSTTDLDGFWRSIWEFAAIEPTPSDGPAFSGAMPDTQWFEHSVVNYASHALRPQHDGIAVISRSQTRDAVELTYDELRDLVARARAGLRRLGVARGDRVAAYLPNTHEAVVAMLAAASLGAVWSSCAPEFGVRAVVDRFGQIEPKVLLAIDGYRYGDRRLDRRTEVSELRAALPSVETTVWLPYLDPDAPAPEGSITLERVARRARAARLRPGAVRASALRAVLVGHDGAAETDRARPRRDAPGALQVPRPAPRHRAGRPVLLVHHDRLDDVEPARVRPARGRDGRVVRRRSRPRPISARCGGWPPTSGITFVRRQRAIPDGVPAGGPRSRFDGGSHAIATVGSTGAPLPADGFRWVYEQLGHDVVLASISGGTDMCTAFVGSVPLEPVVAGEISCRCLGAKVEAFDDTGRSVVGEQGELVITAPMPSMPVGFWGDDDGSRRRAAYFDAYPGVWRHGDWITITDRGSCVISGRSDATLNRGGVRLGTAELYDVVESLPEIADSLVVHLEDDGGGSGDLLLFVQLAPGVALDDGLRGRLAARLRTRSLAAPRSRRRDRGGGDPADAHRQAARGPGEAHPPRR